VVTVRFFSADAFSIPKYAPRSARAGDVLRLGRSFLFLQHGSISTFTSARGFSAPPAWLDVNNVEAITGANNAGGLSNWCVKPPAQILGPFGLASAEQQAAVLCASGIVRVLLGQIRKAVPAFNCLSTSSALALAASTAF